jgi:hypothetical protein
MPIPVQYTTARSIPTARLGNSTARSIRVTNVVDCGDYSRTLESHVKEYETKRIATQYPKARNMLTDT